MRVLDSGVNTIQPRQYSPSSDEAQEENGVPLMTIVCSARLIRQEACTLRFTKPLLLGDGITVKDSLQPGNLYDIEPLKTDLPSAILSFWMLLKERLLLGDD